jgi:hypothetical protein
MFLKNPFLNHLLLTFAKRKGEAEETKLDDEDFLDEGDNHTHNNKTPTLSPTHLNKTITSSSNALVNDIKDFVDDEAEVCYKGMGC